MRETFVYGMPWVLSLIGCIMIWQVGNFKKFGWIVGLVAQVLWFIWIIASEQYGFLPQNFLLAALYAKNFWQWHKSGLEAVK